MQGGVRALSDFPRVSAVSPGALAVSGRRESTRFYGCDKVEPFGHSVRLLRFDRFQGLWMRSSRWEPCAKAQLETPAVGC